MEREIKFRGKTSTLPANKAHKQINGLWCYGYLVGDNKGNYYIKENIKAEGFLVEPETIGQFTGLKDKNGQGIYEGDIVDNGTSHYCITISEVGDWRLYGSKDCWWRLIRDETTRSYMDRSMIIGIEVIGNIHDTPELLNTIEP